MNNYPEFVAEIKERIKDYLPERFADADITVSIRNKNNGVEKVGINVQEKESNVSPTLYMEEFYGAYVSGMTMEQSLQNIGNIIQEISLARDPEIIEDMSNYALIKDKLAAKLINRKMNKEMLRSIPWTKVNDLAEVYMIELNQDVHGSGRITISDEIQQMWGISTQQLRKDALINTQRLHPAELTEVTSCIKQVLSTCPGGELLMPEVLQIPKREEDILFVLSNPTRCLGAECIRYPDILESVRDYLGEDYYVMPSSIHEMLVLRKSNTLSLQDLKESVCDVNQIHVNEEERLSNNVYEYNKGAAELKIAGETKEKQQGMER